MTEGLGKSNLKNCLFNRLRTTTFNRAKLSRKKTIIRHNNSRIIKRPGRLGSWRTGRDYPNDSIAKNGQNPETSPGDLRRLAVTQTPVKNHQLTLM